jgi:hypothetical protein
VNWEAIGAVGEILGAVAVFLSLIYLAVQIRGSTKQSRAAMVQAIASDFAQTHDPYLLNSELAAISRLQRLDPSEDSRLSPGISTGTYIIAEFPDSFLD